MKLNLKLENMNYTDKSYADPYAHNGKVIYKRYEHTFKSGHILVIYTLATGEFWMGDFTAPTGKGGSLPCRKSAQEVLDYFKELLENNEIQQKYIKGFEE